jgi:hypothetical protein
MIPSPEEIADVARKLLGGK